MAFDPTETSEPVESPLSLASEKPGFNPLETSDPVENSSHPLPSSIKQSVFPEDIVSELASTPSEAFDQAVRVSGGNIKWALEAFRGVNPETASRVAQLANQHGVPFQLALEHQKDFEDADEAKKILRSLVERDESGKFKNPHLVRWLADPVNMAKSRDSYDALKKLEDAIRARKSKTQGELGKGEEIKRGLARGAYGVMGSAAGLDLAFQRTVNPSLARIGEFNLLQAQRGIEENPPSESVSKGVFQPGNPTWWVARGSELVRQVLGQIGLAALTRGGSLAAQSGIFMTSSGALMAGDAYNESYQDLINKGATPQEANQVAITEASIVGTIGGAIEAIPGNEFLTENPVLKSVLSRAIRNRFLRRGATGFASEGLEELGQEVATDLAALGIRDDSERFKDAWQRYMASFTLGGAVGGTINVAMTPLASDVETKEETPAASSMQENPVVSQEVIDSMNEDLRKTNELLQNVRKSEGDLSSLDELKALADGVPMTKRDPESVAVFIDGALKEAGHPTTLEVRAEQLAEVFFQGAQTQGEGQTALAQFLNDVGSSVENLEEAIRLGGDVQISTGKFIAKYREHPVFDAIRKDFEEGVEYEKDSVKQHVEDFRAELQKVSREAEVPEPIKRIREKLILPKEEGGAGFSAQETDLQLKLLHSALFMSARERGQTVEEFLVDNPIELRTGEDGKAYIARISQTPAAVNRSEVTKRNLEEDETFFQPAYHGTPHEIEDQFKLENIGTGEGNQVYGWGLYFAENPEVAEDYKLVLGGTKQTYKLDGKEVDIKSLDPLTAAAIRIITKPDLYSVGGYLESRDLDRDSEEAQKLLDEVKILKERVEYKEKDLGNVYTVDIDDQAIKTFLDWDKPISEQSAEIKEIISKLQQDYRDKEGVGKVFYIPEHATGELIYRDITHVLQNTEEIIISEARKRASEYLSSLGIKGIRYLDQGSRGEGKGTSNFVVFDPSIIKITHKNGEPFTPSKSDVRFQSNPFKQAKEKLLAMPAVEITSNAPSDFEELTKWAKSIYPQGEEFVVKANGRKMRLVRGGFKKVKNHSADVRHLKLFAGISQLVENAIPIYQETSTVEGRAIKWNNYAVKTKLDGEDLFVRMTAHEEKEGVQVIDFFYDAHVTEATEVQKVESLQAGTPLAKRDRLRGSKDKLLQWMLGVNEGTMLQGEEDPRGAIEFQGAKTIIHLFEKADLSTLSHEVLHFRLKMMRELIESGLASQQVIADYQSLVEWSGSKNGELSRAQEEKVADAFESYLKEGKAPSVELVEVFRNLRNWLLEIYRSIKSFVTVTPELSAIFDRMLASQNEIKEAREYYATKSDVIDLITNDEAKRRELRDAREKHQKSEEDRHVERILKNYFKVIGGEEALVREAMKEVDSEPFYALLKRAEKDGVSLDKFREKYGENVAKELHAKFPSIFREDGILSIETLAIGFEYESPEALIESMQNELTRDQMIAQRKQERIREEEVKIRHDVRNAATGADAATHSDASLAYLIAEAQALAAELKMKTAGRSVRVLEKVYKDAAKEAIGQMEVGRATRYDVFARTERKWGREVIRLLNKGMKESAYRARQKQLLNHALVAESIKVREELTKLQTRYAHKKFESTLKGVENSYLEPIIEVVSRYKLAERANQKTYDLHNIKELDEILFAMMPDFVRLGEKQGDYRRMLTMDELRELDGFVEAMFTSGRDQMASLSGKELVRFTDFQRQAIERLNRLKKREVTQKGDKLYYPRVALEALLGSNIHAQFMFETADAFQMRTTGKMGPQRKLYQLVAQADTEQLEMESGFYKKARGHFDTISEAVARIRKENGAHFNIKDLPLPEKARATGESRWTPEKLVMVLLNTGNLQNAKALSDGLLISQEQIDIVSQFFTEKELKAIQGIWDSINEFYEPLDQVHFANYNRHIGKVQPAERVYKTKEGSTVTLAGGYFPLIYDSTLSDKAARHEEEDIMQKQAVLRSAKPSDRMTKGRVGGTKDAPKLSLDVLYRHVSETTRYITHSRVLRDMNKLINDPQWKSVFIDKVGNREWKNLKDWVSKTANPYSGPNFIESDTTQGLEKFIEFNRKLSTYLLLGYKVSTAAVQKTGLIIAARRIGWKWMLEGFKSFGITGQLTTTFGFKTEKWNEITKLSSVLRTREEAIDRDAFEAAQGMKGLKKFKLTLGNRTITLKDAQDFGFKMMQMSDRGVVGPTWMGAFQKYLATKSDANTTQDEQIAEAVKYADAIVQETQPTGLTSDRNWIQRSPNKLLRSFVMLMSWRFKYGSILQTEHRAWQEGAISNKEYASHLAQSILLAVLVEELVRGVLRGEMPDWWDLLVKLLEAPISWIPVLGNIPSSVLKGHGLADSIDKLTPAGAALKEFSRESTKAGKALFDEEAAWNDVVWSGARAAGAVSGVPVTNAAKDVNRFVENVTEEEE